MATERKETNTQARSRANKCRPGLGIWYMEWTEDVVGWDTEGIVERAEGIMKGGARAMYGRLDC